MTNFHVHFDSVAASVGIQGAPGWTFCLKQDGHIKFGWNQIVRVSACLRNCLFKLNVQEPLRISSLFAMEDFMLVLLFTFLLGAALGSFLTAMVCLCFSKVSLKWKCQRDLQSEASWWNIFDSSWPQLPCVQNLPAQGCEFYSVQTVPALSETKGEVQSPVWARQQRAIVLACDCGTFASQSCEKKGKPTKHSQATKCTLTFQESQNNWQVNSATKCV